MTVSFVTDLTTTRNTRALAFACGTLAVDDIVIVGVQTEDDQTNNKTGALACTQGGATITSKQVTSGQGNNRTFYQLSTVVITSAGTKDLTVVGTTASVVHGGVAAIFPAADGYSLAGTPALVGGAGVAVTGSGAPSATITTVGGSGSIVFWMNGDWAAIDGASRAYRSSAADRGYTFASTFATLYWATQVTAGSGSQTVGLTAPVGETYALTGVEILFTAPTVSSTPSAILTEAGLRLQAEDGTTLFIDP